MKEDASENLIIQMISDLKSINDSKEDISFALIVVEFSVTEIIMSLNIKKKSSKIIKKKILDEEELHQDLRAIIMSQFSLINTKRTRNEFKNDEDNC